MNHSKSGSAVLVEVREGLFCVRLHDWSDADVLEDRLTEDFDIDPVWRKVEKSEEKESFVLFFAEEKDRALIQKAIDQIT